MTLDVSFAPLSLGMVCGFAGRAMGDAVWDVEGMGVEDGCFVGSRCCNPRSLLYSALVLCLGVDSYVSLITHI